MPEDEVARTVRHVVLVGLMATGKSTVGSVLAERLGRPFIDSDCQIEKNEGRTVREIWLDDGEDAFRELEKTALAEALDHPTPAVIAAAGGVVLDPGNRERLSRSASTVVWLRAQPELLAARAARDDHRPLLDDDPSAAMRSMASSRVPLYREVADLIIEVDDLAPESVADRIEELL